MFRFKSPDQSLQTEDLYAINVRHRDRTTTGTSVDDIIWSSGLAPIVEAQFILSIVASFLSVSYSTGRAVMFQMSKWWTFSLNAIGIAGRNIAGYCFTAVHHPEFNLFAFGMQYVTLYVGVGVLLLLPSEKRNCSWGSQLEVTVATYLNATMGPLYSIVEGYGDFIGNKNKTQYSHCVNARLAAGLNMLPEVVVLVVLAAAHRTVWNLNPTDKVNSLLVPCLEAVGTEIDLSVFPVSIVFCLVIRIALSESLG